MKYVFIPLYSCLLGIFICLPSLPREVWRHVVTGRWIINHRTIPEVDHWNAFMLDKPWTDFAWWFSVKLSLIERILGPQGLLISQLFMGLVFVLFVYFVTVKISGDFTFGSLITGVFALAFASRLEFSTESVGVFCLVGVLAVLSSEIKTMLKTLLYFLFVICWANGGGFPVLSLFVPFVLTVKLSERLKYALISGVIIVATAFLIFPKFSFLDYSIHSIEQDPGFLFGVILVIILSFLWKCVSDSKSILKGRFSLFFGKVSSSISGLLGNGLAVLLSAIIILLFRSVVSPKPDSFEFGVQVIKEKVGEVPVFTSARDGDFLIYLFSDSKGQSLPVLLDSRSDSEKVFKKTSFNGRYSDFKSGLVKVSDLRKEKDFKISLLPTHGKTASIFRQDGSWCEVYRIQGFPGQYSIFNLKSDILLEGNKCIE